MSLSNPIDLAPLSTAQRDGLLALGWFLKTDFDCLVATFRQWQSGAEAQTVLESRVFAIVGDPHHGHIFGGRRRPEKLSR